MGKIANFLRAQRIILPLEQKKQMLAFDKEFEALEAKVTVLQAENLKLGAEVNPLKQEIERLQAQVKNNPSEYACDHCGSNQLKRTTDHTYKHKPRIADFMSPTASDNSALAGWGVVIKQAAPGSSA